MRILIIDDHPHFLSTIVDAVASEGYEVVSAENGSDGLRLAERGSFDLVITDIFMPEMDGIAFIVALREKLPRIPVIAMSGGGKYGDISSLKASNALGATYTILKPFPLQELIDLVSTALGLPGGESPVDI